MFMPKRSRISPPMPLLSVVRFKLARLGLLALCSVAIAQNPAISKIAPFIQSAPPSASVNPLTYPADTIFEPVHMNVKITLEAITEIDADTCKLISTGEYEATTEPKYGVTSYAVHTLKDPSPPCENDPFLYHFAYYTWTKDEADEPQDFFHLHWYTPDGTTDDTDWLAELIPKAEMTKFNNWWSKQPTVGQWQQTLDLTTIHYAGVRVRETAPTTQKEVCIGTGPGAACTPDTCYYPGSIYPAYIQITGGTWPVKDGNLWGFDKVGRGTNSVTYYRHAGRAPCYTTFPQQMQIQFATGDPNWYNYGDVNTLGYDLDATTVISIRAGASEKETWP
jgi:hypothetical protein